MIGEVEDILRDEIWELVPHLMVQGRWNDA